jgi:hypothetical protein
MKIKMAVFWDDVYSGKNRKIFKGVNCLYESGRFAVMMEAVSCCERRSVSTRLQSATSQKTAIFILLAARTLNLTEYEITLVLYGWEILQLGLM